MNKIILLFWIFSTWIYLLGVVFNYTTRYPRVIEDWNEEAYRHKIAASFLYPIEGYFLERA